MISASPGQAMHKSSICIVQVASARSFYALRCMPSIVMLHACSTIVGCNNLLMSVGNNNCTKVNTHAFVLCGYISNVRVQCFQWLICTDIFPRCIMMQHHEVKYNAYTMLCI
jgi:hypothetical protein